MTQQMPQQPGTTNLAFASQGRPPSVQDIANVSTLSAAQRVAFMNDLAAAQGAAPAQAPCVDCANGAPPQAAPVSFDLPSFPTSAPMQPMPSDFPSTAVAGGFFLGDGSASFQGGPTTPGVVELCSGNLYQNGVMYGSPVVFADLGAWIRDWEERLKIHPPGTEAGPGIEYIDENYVYAVEKKYITDCLNQKPVTKECLDLLKDWCKRHPSDSLCPKPPPPPPIRPLPPPPMPGAGPAPGWKIPLGGGWSLFFGPDGKGGLKGVLQWGR